MWRLDSVEVEGYKSIRSAKIELGAVSALIGANGAGKSNILGIFGLLAALADRRLQLQVAREGGANAVLHFGSKQTRALRISLRSGFDAYELALVPVAGDTLVFEYERLAVGPRKEDLGAAGLKETALHADENIFGGIDSLTKSFVNGIGSWRQFHFHDTGPSSPPKQKRRIDDNRTLRRDAENLAPFLFALQRTSPGAYRSAVLR
jgi:predicted ATPase